MSKQNKLKNKWLAVIMSFFFVGAGHAYIGKWGTFLGFVVLQIIMYSVGISVLIPMIAAIAVYRDVNKYNEEINKNGMF